MKVKCGVAGIAESPFSVFVDESVSVEELRSEIHRIQFYQFPASRLQLFLAKKDGGNWVTTNDVEAGLCITDHMEKLADLDATLSTVGLSAGDVTGSGNAHVLVLLPTATVYCGVVGKAGTFPVKIDQNMSVGELKEVIREKQQYQLPASTMELFLEEKDNGKGVADKVEGGVDVTEYMTQLDDAEARLNSVGLSSDTAGSGNVRVWVKLSTTSSIGLVQSDELPLYTAVAERLKDSDGVKQLVTTIKMLQADARMKCISPAKMPFIVLENSSGTGKTQMAFNLQATGECDVFHMLCTAQGKDRQQSVYGSFDQRSAAFRAYIDKDMTQKFKLCEGSVGDFEESERLFIYGFIIAALGGLEEYSGLEASRSDVKTALSNRRKKTDKTFVFFLDEFPRVGNLKDAEMNERRKRARMMRNVFRSFRIVVVASATNGTARDLVTTSRDSRVDSSSRGETPWCVVVPSFPAFATSANVDAPWLWILKHSRPLFSYRAQLYMKEHPFESSGTDQLEYLTDMAKTLAGQFRALKQLSATGEFELGQFCMLLCTSYKEVDGSVNLIDGHYGRFRETAPFTLYLSGATEGLFKQIENEEGTPAGKRMAKWDARCKLPLPEEDILLHLALVDECIPAEGGKAAKVLRPLRFPVHEEWQQINMPCDPSNILARSNSGMSLEALVAAAVVLASHRDGFYGVKFPEFLGRLLFELGVEKNPECVKELPKQLKHDTIIPFLSMPNTEWPGEFLQEWQRRGAMFANMKRTADAERIDFEVLSNEEDDKISLADKCKTHEVLSGMQIAETHLSGGSKKAIGVDKEMILSGECKDRGSLVLDELRRILARVPKLTGIHLVTVQKLQDKYFTKKATTECEETAESEETAECKETTKCTELKLSTTDYTESVVDCLEHHITKAKKSVTERTASVESDAQSCAESNVPTGQVTPPPKPDVSKMSASK